jgi:hypothetical protein
MRPRAAISRPPVKSARGSSNANLLMVQPLCSLQSAPACGFATRNVPMAFSAWGRGSVFPMLADVLTRLACAHSSSRSNEPIEKADFFAFEGAAVKMNEARTQMGDSLTKVSVACQQFYGCDGLEPSSPASRSGTRPRFQRVWVSVRPATSPSRRRPAVSTSQAAIAPGAWI